MRGSKVDKDATTKRIISIHASTWEAARMHFQQAVLTCNFNSRLYMRGSFKAIPKQRCKSFYFNSRLYMRGSFPSSKDFFVYKKFQFTPLHERQQLIVSKEKLLRIISIHASTWEAALNGIKPKQVIIISIHASTWEAARYCNRNYTAANISNHASTWEAAIALERFSALRTISIHASTWEAAQVV